MKRFIIVMCISLSSLSLTGCNDLLQQITNFITPADNSEDAIQRKKIQSDLKIFDSIRSDQNSAFYDLEETLKKATSKETSTAAIRAELVSFANKLHTQNDRFKVTHIQTPEVAKLRNVVMQLNYETIIIIQTVDNPAAVNNRLRGYLNTQNKLLNEYNKLRTEIEASL